MREPTNPLNPAYKLPYAEPITVSPPKFIRDQIDISDIDGTRPNPKYIKPRKQDIYTEVQGSKPKVLFIPRDHVDILDVKDINEFRQFKSTRITDILNPVYVLPNEDG